MTSATCCAASGCSRASQRSLVTGCAACGTVPTACAHASRPPNVSTRSAAAVCTRRSLPSSAGPTGFPPLSRATRPCCCAATPMAWTSASCPVLAALPSEISQDWGSSRSPVCSAWPCLMTPPVSVSQTTMLVYSAELSSPATIPMAGMMPHTSPYRGSTPVSKAAGPNTDTAVRGSGCTRVRLYADAEARRRRTSASATAGMRVSCAPPAWTTWKNRTPGRTAAQPAGTVRSGGPAPSYEREVARLRTGCAAAVGRRDGRAGRRAGRRRGPRGAAAG